MNNSCGNIVPPSKDTTSDFPGKGNTRALMGREVPDNIFMWDDIVHVKVAIARLKHPDYS